MPFTRLHWTHADVHVDIAWSPELAPHLTTVRMGEATSRMSAAVPLVEVLTAADGHALACDALVRTVVGRRMRYTSHQDLAVEGGRTLELRSTDPVSGIQAELTLYVADRTSALRCSVVLTNTAAHPVVLRSVTSFAAPLGDSPARTGATSALGIGDWSIHRGTSEWLGEGRWTSEPADLHTFPDLAEHLTGHDPRGAYSVTSTGPWSTGSNLPVAFLTNTAAQLAWGWQVEHNGSWRWEIGRQDGDGYIALSGPTDTDHAWVHPLAPGSTFTTVPVAITVADSFTAAAANLIRYRRAVRRDHPDNTDLPIIFNDYMNTLNGDPTTAKLLPLVDAAAGAGAEVFCVDAGWYDDGGDWWDSVGEWKPSTTRFPGGLVEVIDRIHSHDMVSGLWLEPEVVGVRSPVADALPAEAFWQRCGQRIVEHGRYHLDLRHPAARQHLDDVVDRLVGQFGVGYFKLDYNIAPGSGSDLNASSPGQALLEHNRAVLAWLDGVLDRYPDLILENCGSGAMRADFAMLSRLQLQSTSDQQDAVKYAPIAATSPLLVLPEQAASWAYPSAQMMQEEVAFTLATALTGRLFLSGYLNQLPQTHLALVQEAVALAKDLRAVLPSALPRWPLGLPRWDAPWVALLLATKTGDYLTLWNRSPQDACIDLRVADLLPTASKTGAAAASSEPTASAVEVEQIFPARLSPWDVIPRPDPLGEGLEPDASEGPDKHAQAQLRVRNPTGQVSARVFRITAT